MSDAVRTATAGATDAAPLNAVSGAEDVGAFRIRDLVDSGLRVMASSGDTIRAATSLSGEAVRILAGPPGVRRLVLLIRWTGSEQDERTARSVGFVRWEIDDGGNGEAGADHLRRAVDDHGHDPDGFIELDESVDVGDLLVERGHDGAVDDRGGVDRSVGRLDGHSHWRIRQRRHYLL